MASPYHGVASSLDPRPRRFRGLGFAGVFVGGMAVGLALAYGLQIMPVNEGHSHTDRRLHTSPTVATNSPRAQSDSLAARAPTNRMFPGDPTDDGALARLIEQVDRQIAEGSWDPSASDSAIETYRRLAEAFPGNAATAQLGERLSAAIWSKAKSAERAERWDEAVQLYTVLKALPPNPTAAILADQRPPAGGIDAPAAEPAEPAAALANAPVPDAPTGRAREIGGSTAAGSAALSVTEQRDITAVATARGDEAMLHGDVISARRFYEVAASQGSPRAMTALGRTYDPLFLQEKGVRGLLADAVAARRWYQQAADHGEAEAQARMNKLLQANAFSARR